MRKTGMSREYILWKLPYKEGLKLIHAMLIAEGAHVKWVIPRKGESQGLLNEIQKIKNAKN